ncbi:Uncharacterised protein [Mycobacteroides abscessus]|nr:Uncharacterised protein [Mycobacteroides abscessus]CPZ80579.1 Uncharacterised protein [Mycobacteroides abscessus]SKZ51099.1 Uncharacterised protein [Mycobacteroides abscessus subsp. abscessus]
MLFAGLQRKPVCGRTVGIHRDSDEASRQLAGVGGVHREIPRVRPTEAHRHTEALCGAKGDVGADVSGRSDESKGQQVRTDRHQRAALVRRRDQRRPVAHHPGGPRQLHDYPEEISLRKTSGKICGHHVDAERFGARGDHGGGLRVQVGVDDKSVGRRLHGAMHERHRLGRRGALVEHRGVGDIEPGELGDHRLKVQ